jgi:hypothetical protein
VFDARPEVFAHNVETVPRIFKRIRPAFRYERSLDVLTQARAAGLITKSNLILGMGEEPEEVVQALQDLHDAGTDIITITQYLRPTPRHLPVARWVKPHEFVEFKEEAERIGFLGVLAGPSCARRTGPDACGRSRWSRRGGDPAHLSHLADETELRAGGLSARRGRASVGAGDRLHVAVARRGSRGARRRWRRVERVLEHGEGSVPPCSSARIVMLTSCSDRMMSMWCRRRCRRGRPAGPRRLLLLQEVLGDLAGAVVELATMALRACRSICSSAEIIAAATSSAACETSS